MSSHGGHDTWYQSNRASSTYLGHGRIHRTAVRGTVQFRAARSNMMRIPEWHDINLKLVDESRIQELLGDADAADHLHCLISSGSFCLGDYGFHTVDYEREGQVLVL